MYFLFIPLPFRFRFPTSYFFTDHLSTIELSLEEVRPTGIAATPSGVLIVTCQFTHSVYAIDPSTGHCKLVVAFAKPKVSQRLGSNRAVWL